MRSSRRAERLRRAMAAFGLGTGLITASVLEAQSTVEGRELYSLNIADARAGSLPPGITMRQGTFSVVMKDGMPMLKASSRTEFVIELPQRLPESFTLVFQIIPKACCNPEDLAFEGRRVITRGSGSAEIQWHREHLVVLGGGPNYTAEMPSDLRETLPAALTTVAVAFEGETVKLYTNGRRLFTLSDRPFVRGRELRVFLGGQDAGAQAVYLARLSIVGGTSAIAQQGMGGNQPGGGGNQAPGTGPGTGSDPNKQPSEPASPTLVVIKDMTVRARPTGGAELFWTETVPGAVRYEVEQSTDGQTYRVVGTVAHDAQGAGGFNAVVEPLQAGQQYHFKLAARRSDGVLVGGSYIRLFTATVANPPQPPTPPEETPPSNPDAPRINGFSLTPDGVWGLRFRWNLMTEGEWYYLEARDNDFPFARIGGHHRGTNLTSDGGQFTTWYSLEPGHRYQFRVSAYQPDRTTVVGSSEVLAYDAPAQYPQVTNLRATVGEFGPVTLGTGATVSGRRVTWTWDPLSGAQSYLVTANYTATDAATNQITTSHMFGSPGAAVNQQPGFSLAYPAPVTARLCVSAIPATASPNFEAPVCLDAEVPGGTVAGNEPTERSSTVGRLPGSNIGKVPAAGSTTSPAPAPTELTVRGTPAAAWLGWAPVPGAVGYTVQRSVSGSQVLTTLTAQPITSTIFGADILPDRTRTYTYQVNALQADGRFGIAKVDYTAPPPAEPTFFYASAGNPGEVNFRVQPLADVYLIITGPGAGTGIRLIGGTFQHKLTGVPAGTHTWQVAVEYQPGGILTPSGSWKTATTTVTSGVSAVPLGATGMVMISVPPAPTGPGTAAAPVQLNAVGSPRAVWLAWSAVAGADRYRVDRAPVGTTTWTSLHDQALRNPEFGPDLLPFANDNYEYRVTAYQPDGTYGWATVTYTVPPRAEPAYFYAAPGPAAGQVHFRVAHVSYANRVITGPGTGSGIVLKPGEVTYTLSGVPAGTHTWTVAVDYQPGGIVSYIGARLTATATIIGHP